MKLDTMKPGALVAADGDVMWFCPIYLGKDPDLRPVFPNTDRNKLIPKQLNFGIDTISRLLSNPEAEILNHANEIFKSNLQDRLKKAQHMQNIKNSQDCEIIIKRITDILKDNTPESRIKLFNPNEKISFTFSYTLDSTSYVVAQGALQSNHISVFLPKRPRLFNPHENHIGETEEMQAEEKLIANQYLISEYPNIFSPEEESLSGTIKLNRPAYFGFTPGYDTYIIEEVGGLECERGFGFAHIDPLGDSITEELQEEYFRFNALMILNPVLMANLLEYQKSNKNMYINANQTEKYLIHFKQSIDISPAIYDISNEEISIGSITDSDKVHIKFVATKQAGLGHFKFYFEKPVPLSDSSPQARGGGGGNSPNASLIPGNCLKIAGMVYLFYNPATGQNVTMSFQQAGDISWSGLQGPPFLQTP